MTKSQLKKSILKFCQYYEAKSEVGLGSEAWRNKTKEITTRSRDE